MPGRRRTAPAGAPSAAAETVLTCSGTPPIATARLSRNTVRKYLAAAEAVGMVPGGPPVSPQRWADLAREWFPELAVSHLPAGRLGELVTLGVVIERPAGEYCVPSPSLLGLLHDAIANGVSADGALALVGAIAAGARGIASAVAATLGGELGDRADDEAVVAVLRRGRVPVAQATSRLLLHELGLALAEPATRPEGPGWPGWWTGSASAAPPRRRRM